MSIRNLLRENIRSLEPYSSARDDFSGSASVFLDANENWQEFVDFDDINRYPDPHSAAVKKGVRSVFGYDEKTVSVGNGSDELIDIMYRLFCTPGRDSVLIMPPTYGEYKVLAEINDVKVHKVLQNPDFTLNAAEVKKAIDEYEPKLMFICSPNNPTGASVPFSVIKELSDYNKGITVVDEAYLDFSASESAVSLIGTNERVVVLRTLSKAWALAGARIGLAVSSPEIAELVYMVKYPYNVPVLSQVYAARALSRADAVRGEVKRTISERSRVKALLEGVRGVHKVFDSDANFLLVRLEKAHEVFLALREMGIIVRDRTREVLCDSCLRITIGSKEENDMMIKAVREVLGGF
ncbi:MAG: histidinol-phosphate transaminase [Bullifex sp.]